MSEIQSIQLDGTTKPAKLIAALGNPGKEYEHTYHNAGWLFVDFLKNKLGTKSEKSGHFYKYYKVRDSALLLAEPNELFMNDSGQYIASLLNNLRLKPHEFILVHDDSDIPLGSYKLSSGSGSAGHKGVKSVIDALGTKDFMRLRIGIRHKEGKALDFVLSEIKPAENKILLETFETIFLETVKGF